MALFLYNVLLVVLAPLWLAYLAWHPRTKGTLKERLGRIALKPAAKGGVWVHAVSVGELAAAGPLLAGLLEKGTPVVLTTSTRAAQEVAQRRYGGQPKVAVTYMPVDFPPVLNRFLAEAAPKALVIFETELWPNLLRLAHGKGVKTLWLNARVSDRMLAQKGFVRALHQAALSCFDVISPQSDQQLERLKKVFDPGHRLGPVGQTKLDVLPPPCPEDVRIVVEGWKGEKRIVIMVGSTHDPEEEVLLHLALNQKQWDNICHVVVVPRHLERVAQVADLAKKMGFVTGFRSKLGEMPALLEGQRACLVVDSTGELASLYEVADIAFVGGSFINRGGHNVLEPAAWGVPTFVGPHTQNFTEMVVWLKELGLLKQEEKPDMLERQWIDLFRDRPALASWRSRNQEKLHPYRGITQKHLELLKDI